MLAYVSADSTDRIWVNIGNNIVQIDKTMLINSLTHTQSLLSEKCNITRTYESLDGYTLCYSRWSTDTKIDDCRSTYYNTVDGCYYKYYTFSRETRDCIDYYNPKLECLRKVLQEEYCRYMNSIDNIFAALIGMCIGLLIILILVSLFRLCTICWKNSNNRVQHV